MTKKTAVLVVCCAEFALGICYGRLSRPRTVQVVTVPILVPVVLDTAALLADAR